MSSKVMSSLLCLVKHYEFTQIIYVAVCYHVNKKNIKLVLCAWVSKEYDICRGWSTYSGIFVPKIVHIGRGLTELLRK